MNVCVREQSLSSFSMMHHDQARLCLARERRAVETPRIAQLDPGRRDGPLRLRDDRGLVRLAVVRSLRLRDVVEPRVLRAPPASDSFGQVVVNPNEFPMRRSPPHTPQGSSATIVSFRKPAGSRTTQCTLRDEVPRAPVNLKRARAGMSNLPSALRARLPVACGKRHA